MSITNIAPFLFVVFDLWIHIRTTFEGGNMHNIMYMLLLLLTHFSRVRLCATP